MSDDARREILERVRSASRRDDDIDGALAALRSGPIAPLPNPDLRTALLTNILRNHGSAALVADRSAAVTEISAYIGARYKSRKLVAGSDPRLAALPWREGGLLPRFGDIEQGDAVSVSYARLAVAETGSTVLISGRDNPSRNNLLPEDHIVLVDSADIVTSLDEVWPYLPSQQASARHPRSVQLISGPSSTADIAMHMVFGAHGPRSWHVILIDAEAEGCLETARTLAADYSASGS